MAGVGAQHALVLPQVELRPQSVLLTFFGDFVDGENDVVAAADVIDVLGGAGIGVHAARATLTRMVSRGLLRRAAAGRRAYFGLTVFGRRTVLDGRTRAQTDTDADTPWDGRWTLVSFSLPDGARRERHDLRSRLTWAGFGMIQAGLWAAPREVDVPGLLAGLSVGDGVNAFRGALLAPSDGVRLVSSAFDLDRIAARYEGFVQRWQGIAAAADLLPNPLVARIVLSTDWLLVIRDDPRLPHEFLPHPWPGSAARSLHGALESALRAPSEDAARRRLDVRRCVEGRVV